MVYTEIQLRTLRELRKLFFESGFEVYNMLKRYRKHPLEFVIVEKSDREDDSVEKRKCVYSAAVRLFYGSVRIVFFEVSHPLSRAIEEKIVAISKKSGLAPIRFAREYRNQIHNRFPMRAWHGFVYKKEFQETGFAKAKRQFANVEIVLRKGDRALV